MEQQQQPSKPVTKHTLKLPSIALTVLLTSLLAACGGGGGGSEAGPAIDPAQLKGRWVTAAGVTPAVTALVVPDASGTASAWLLSQDATRLVKLVVRSDSSANGKSYSLSQSNATGQTVTGQVSATLTTSPKGIAFTGVNTTTLSLSQSDALGTAAAQAELAGTWSATSGGNAQTTRWSITSTGSTTGTSTTGCAYAGAVNAIASTAAYGVQVTESCPDGTKTTFTGIGSLNAAKNGLTVVLTSADETRGAAVFFSK